MVYFLANFGLFYLTAYNCSVDIKYLSINDFAFLSALFASGNTGIT